MAARRNKTVLTESWKAKIQASLIAGRLYDHMQGLNEMSSTQIKAAQILLNKLIPDLGRLEMTGEGGGPVQLEAIQRTVVDPK